MNYNTDKTLWEKHLADRIIMGRPQQYSVWDGMVTDGINVIARFASQNEAIKTLGAAGWLIRSQGESLPHLACSI